MNEISRRMTLAVARYGPFASSHEALGVALEEWDELREAVHANDPAKIKHECLDLAAVLIRFAEAMDNPAILRRSVK